MLSIALPFTTVMFIAGACRRGGGDTLTPAIVMVIVDHREHGQQLCPDARVVGIAGDGV